MAERPLVLLGEGARGANMERVLGWGLPILTSWQAKDMIDNHHRLYFGSPGIYGQRVANTVLAAADYVLAIGNRLSIWNVGHGGIRTDQELVWVESDPAEARRYRDAWVILTDARRWVGLWRDVPRASEAWLLRCMEWRNALPLLEAPAHDDADGYINSYGFVRALERYLAPDQVIVTEMGAALCSAFQVLRIRPPQRLMTSGGLGEMGCALPAALGASFARGGGPVLCLSTDGGMMLNLQELQTLVHHRLPVKIIVFNNGGYGMLKQTQDNAGMRHSGVDERCGVSFPNFRHVAGAFGITASEVRTWADFERIIPSFMSRGAGGPELVDFVMSPRQRYLPKLGYAMRDGRQVYGSFADMEPRLEERAEMRG